MGRVERLRQARRVRRRYTLAVLLFTAVLTAGMITADYSIKNLMGVNKGNPIASIHNLEQYTEIEFLGYKLYFNKENIKNDVEKLYNKIYGLK